MKGRLPTLALLFIGTAILVAPATIRARETGGEKGPVYDLAKNRCKVAFDASSTLHHFTGTTRAVTGTITCRFDDLARLCRAKIVIDATTLDSGNRKRDREMHADYLETKRFPRIVFTVESATGVKKSRVVGQYEFTMHGTLDLHGKKGTVSIPARASKKGDELRATGWVRLDMTKYGIEPPSRMLGMIRVSKLVTIRFDVRAVPHREPDAKPPAGGTKQP